jgi:hypothetical protein
MFACKLIDDVGPALAGKAVFLLIKFNVCPGLFPAEAGPTSSVKLCSHKFCIFPIQNNFNGSSFSADSCSRSARIWSPQ